jgi:hypothetical protein
LCLLMFLPQYLQDRRRAQNKHCCRTKRPHRGLPPGTPAPLACHLHGVELADEVAKDGGTVAGISSLFLIVEADDAPCAEC